MDVKAETDEARLLSWYQNIIVRRFDLIGDYAGNELFLIEGDSLLRHCFSTSKVDFDDGFQMLHAVHAVESFLSALRRRKCNFHLAFFENHRELCVPSDVHTLNGYKYLLTREILMRHLQRYLKPQVSGFQVLVFKSIDCADFNDYLASAGVYFLMCHDGASGSCLKANRSTSAMRDENQRLDHRDSDFDNGAATSLRDEFSSRIALRHLIYRFIRQGYGVALVNGLEWKDSKVIASVVEGYERSLPTIAMDLPHLQVLDENPDGATSLEDFERLAPVKDLTERDILTVLTLSELLRQDRSESTAFQGSALVLHTALLNAYPLSARRFEQEPLRHEDAAFLRLFSQTAQKILRNESIERSIPNIRLQASCSVDKEFGKVDLAFAPVEVFPVEGQLVRPAGPQLISESSSVMPFNNRIFDLHLEPITLNVEDQFPEQNHNALTQNFKELSHWHNSKKPVGPKNLQKKLGFFAHRRNQRNMAEMMAYAASLTNSVGKILEPETVVVYSTIRGDTQTKLEGRESKQHAKGSKTKPAGPNRGKAAARAEAANLQAKKADAKGKQLLAAWRSRCKDWEKEELLSRWINAVKYKSSLGKLETAMVGSEVELYMVGVLALIWIRHCKEKTKHEGMSIVALLWYHLNHLGVVEGLTSPIWSKVELTVKMLRLPEVSSLASPKSDRPLSFEFPLDRTVQADVSIPVDPLEFQLLHCSPYLDRSIDSAPDDRVPFEPDGWQRRVLDAIDARKSLFVVAPTSTGKTFISFYAMKQILRSGDDEILVYVAPTKALVTQIAAEVQARFSKVYAYKSRSVWAIHTRDHRVNNPTGCQILVTVPHILQIMLLAPSNAEKINSWSCRVKRIIFDEVHCIGQAEDGIVWEQLLMLAPCPIIALSATVGNPEEFNEWLKCTQASVGNELVMIQHPHRYSDLRKFIYIPPKTFSFNGLLRDMQLPIPGLDTSRCSTGGFAFVHPVGSLINSSRGMPDDLSLEARDCFNLWRSMNEHQTSEYKVDESLIPCQALPEIIRKTDIIYWESQLKKVLKRWMGDPSSPFEKIRTNLQATVDRAERADFLTSGDDLDHNHDDIQLVDQQDLCSTTLPMLTDLHNRDALPAILFNYERGMCEKICQRVSAQLKAAEDSWKVSSSRWAKKLADYEHWQKMQSKSAKRQVIATGGGKKGRNEDEDEKISKAEQEREAANREGRIWDSFNPEAPLDAFNFSDKTKLSMSDLEGYEKQLGGQEQPQWLVEALRRGIGVHHAGMNRKYRQIVEILFRKGFLRVVIATGTLALGINMPCKTVVFSGDSVFLTALNFRQAAGRAGRRGFDLLGNVVFQGISQEKVYRLLSSRLPDLNGHFPISTTLVLRLFTLLHESKNSEFAKRAVNSLLSQPRLYLGGPESKSTVLHHLRFSIEYLRRQLLLGMDGAPLNFAGCVSHLYFTENSSFAFHALLKEGYFHELCSDIDRNPERVLDTIMLVMAHLFGRIPCRQVEKEWIERVVTRSPSLVFLRKLPSAAEKILRKHNADILSTFTTYVKTFIQQHVRQEDCRLPLTGVKCGGDGSTGVDMRLKPLPSTRLRSPFAALSGYDDNFDSIADLCRNVRSDVILEESVVPHIAIAPDETNGPLNAYLYDFFRHGSIEALRKANRIRKGDVWFLLKGEPPIVWSLLLALVKTNATTYCEEVFCYFADLRLQIDFSLILATIVTSLENFIKPSSTASLDVIDLQGDEDSDQDAQDESGQEDSGEAEGGAQDAGDNIKSPWESRGGQSLFKVLRAFQKLKLEFDDKFKAMWA